MPTRSTSRPDDVLEFLRLIWEMNHHLQSVSKRMSRVLGITGPQRLALRMIGREPGMPTLRLATLLHLHPSTVTGILDRLERGGLVARATDRKDARTTRLRLTRRGHRVNAVTAGTVEHAVSRGLATLATGRIAAGRELLLAVCTALEATAENRGASPRPAPRRVPGRRARTP
jgi:DNA-binding MarR family transcriptional regulator